MLMTSSCDVLKRKYHDVTLYWLLE